MKINPQNTLAQTALAALEDKPLATAAAVPINKWGSIEKDTPQPKTRSARVRPYSCPDTIPIAIALFVIALIPAAVTYIFTREDLAYRSEGRVTSAIITQLKNVGQCWST